MMLTQSLEQLPYQVDHLEKILINSVKAKRWAYIVHDDKEEFKHVHAVLEFENARSIKAVAKLLHIEPQYIEKWKGSVKNAYSYLLHRTAEARAENKKSYEPSEVSANFDFVQTMQEIELEITSAKNKQGKKRINELLDLFDLEVISRIDLEEELSGSEFASVVRKMDSIERKINNRKFRQFKDKMTAENKKIETIWIFGEAGAGKTRLAKDIANSNDGNYYFSGSNNDPFQGYLGQPRCILDELRPNTFTYNELLKLLDPFGFETVASSRYFDKPLTIEQFIVTTPFDPLSFYQRIRGLDRSIDKPQQLFRRLSLVVEVTNEFIIPQYYDAASKNFVAFDQSRENNPYAEKNALLTQRSSSEYFEKLTEMINNEHDSKTDKQS